MTLLQFTVNFIYKESQFMMLHCVFLFQSSYLRERHLISFQLQCVLFVTSERKRNQQVRAMEPLQMIVILCHWSVKPGVKFVC